MLIENINFYDFLQHIFYKQWSELKTYEKMNKNN